MSDSDSQVPWTDEQWARVNQVIQEEARRARVAATFLPLFGPLQPSADFVRKETISDGPPLTIDDTDIIKLLTLQVKVPIRGAQMADPEMASVLALFRRAANVLARLEDALIFNGRHPDTADPAGAPPKIWEIATKGTAEPLLPQANPPRTPAFPPGGQGLVTKISEAIGTLEGRGHFGPFAVVLGKDLFLTAQTPDPGSLVLPQDRIIPFLGGGPLLRSSTLPDPKGVVVALGGAPVELVVATDVSLGFLQITQDPLFVFRVFEKIALRIKQSNAIVALHRP
jgi:uncharacterized linocin/CFP29 family protein